MLTTVSTWVSILQSVVTIVALVVGAYVAWVGLNTWKEQMLARSEYELARRILMDVYKVKHALWNARLNVGDEVSWDFGELRD